MQRLANVLHNQNPVLKWKPMPDTNQSRAAVSPSPPRPPEQFEPLSEDPPFQAQLQGPRPCSRGRPPALTVRVLQHRAVLHKGYGPCPFCQAPAGRNQ